MKKIIPVFLLCLIVSAAAAETRSNNAAIAELNAKAFGQKVWNFDKDKLFCSISSMPVIINFTAAWVPPCKKIAPNLQAIQNKYNRKLVIYSVDVDKEPGLAKRFNVQSMPTLIFVTGKTTYKAELGYRDYDSLDLLVQNYFFSGKK